MVYKCVVPLCRGNYASGPRVHTFGFPKDDVVQRKWIIAIKRKDYEPTKYSRVCELHFNPHDVERSVTTFNPQTGQEHSVTLDYPRLVKNAIPSIIPNAPSYLSTASSSRTCPSDKWEERENRQLRKAISASFKSKKAYDESQSITSLKELIDQINKSQLKNWTVVKNEECIVLAYVVLEPAPLIRYSVIVSDKLVVTAFIEKVELRGVKDYELPMTVSDFNIFLDMLNCIESLETPSSDEIVDTIVKVAISILKGIADHVNEEQCSLLKFVLEQIDNIIVKKCRVRYSPDMMIYYSLIYSISPHAYRFMRSSGNVKMPHPTTIYNVCSKLDTNPINEQNEYTFLRYIKTKVVQLQESDLHVNLLMDEIHLKSYFDYKGGNIVGAAYNSEIAATSAYVFMINSLFSPYKDVAHILPVASFTAQNLYQIVYRIIIGLENVGFKVMSIVSDNNSINRKAITYFSPHQNLSITYPHPCDSQRPLFFVIDPVHILKCIRNNWINQKRNNQGLYYPDFDTCSLPIEMHTASFGALKDLYKLEYDNLLKYGHGISMKALCPSNLERQNVKLVLQIFNNVIAQALLELGKKHSLQNYEGTAQFIKIISHWWCTVNVKTPFKGKRFNDLQKEPLTFTETDENSIFLNKLVAWLDRWEKCGNLYGTLSKETHFALKHSTSALIEMGKYCISNLEKSYFLPGSVQTDPLEARFGKYRQLSGSQYCVSIRQIYESESKLRMQNLTTLSITSSMHGDIDVGIFDINCNDDYSFTLNTLSHMVDNLLPQVFVDDDDILKCESFLPVITYLAGYCVYSSLKQMKCEFCKDCLSLNKQLDLGITYKLIKDLDRGRLMYPHHDVINAVTFNYVVIQKLVSKPLEEIFLKCRHQRQLACKLTLSLLSECDKDFEFCDSGHSIQNIFKTIVWKSTNAILKNYCKKKNDIPVKCIAKKRKLKTLQE